MVPCHPRCSGRLKALPRILDRFNPFAASLLLGAVWGIWHLPSLFVSGLPQAGMQIPVFLLAAYGPRFSRAAKVQIYRRAAAIAGAGVPGCAPL